MANAFPRSTDVERLDNDRQSGREHEGAAGALDGPKGHNPGLGRHSPWGSGRTSPTPRRRRSRRSRPSWCARLCRPTGRRKRTEPPATASRRSPPIARRWRVSPSSFWICGTAMDTIVWSMKVMATANIIAAKTRFLELLRPSRGQSWASPQLYGHFGQPVRGADQPYGPAKFTTELRTASTVCQLGSLPRRRPGPVSPRLPMRTSGPPTFKYLSGQFGHQ